MYIYLYMYNYADQQNSVNAKQTKNLSLLYYKYCAFEESFRGRQTKTFLLHFSSNPLL